MIEELRRQSEELQPEIPEQKIETELSPEIVEKIMAKVEDLNSPNLGYSCISNKKISEESEVLSSVLENGILGMPTSQQRRASRITPEGKWVDARGNWVKDTRKYKDTVVYFNIPGRGDVSQLPTQISNSDWIMGNTDSIVMLFDLTKFSEGEPHGHRNSTQRNRTYYHDDFAPELYKKWKKAGFAKEAKEKLDYDGVDPEFGFVLSHRVAPRFFKGIAIGLTRPLNENEIRSHFEYSRRLNKEFGDGKTTDEEIMADVKKQTKKEKNPESFKIEAEKLASLMLEVGKNKPENLIPIYDIYGNLLWPQQMSYEEVKKFVSERDVKNNL